VCVIGVQEGRRKAINAVRRQWEATMASKRRSAAAATSATGKAASSSSASANADLHASLFTTNRDSSPDR